METLDGFLAELRADVAAFEKYWREKAKKRPKNYPMSFPKEDAGMWWEQFMAFRSMNGNDIDD